MKIKASINTDTPNRSKFIIMIKKVVSTSKTIKTRASMFEPLTGLAINSLTIYHFGSNLAWPTNSPFLDE